MQRWIRDFTYAARSLARAPSFTLIVVATPSFFTTLGAQPLHGRLLMRSFWQLSNVDAGYDTEGIFTFQVAARRPDLNDRAAMSRFQYEFRGRLKALPGVESVGYITTLPLDEGAGSQNITTPGLEASGAEAPLVRVAGAGGAYFQTMGIELLRGRCLPATSRRYAPHGLIR